MIVYSMTSGLSLLNLFLAGYIPGMMIGVGLMILCYFVAKRKGYGRSNSDFTWQRVVVTFRRSILAILHSPDHRGRNPHRGCSRPPNRP